jgi:hypothetical protein
VGVISAFYLVIGFNLGLSRYDEGLTVYGAMRVMAGDVPYRDFWSLYAPGQFYTLAALFSTFGSSIMAERVWYLIVTTMLATLVYLLAARVLRRRYALVAWAFALIWIDSYGLRASPVLPGMVFVVAGLLALAGYRHRGAVRLLFLGGWCIGVSGLYRHDFAVPLFWSPRRARGAPPPAAGMRRQLLLFTGGAVMAVGPAILCTVLAVPWNVLWGDLVVFPAKIFPAVRSLPYPSPIADLGLLTNGSLFAFAKETLLRLPFYFPMLVLAAAGGVVVRRARRDKYFVSGAGWEVLLLWLISSLLLAKALVRTERSNLVPAYICLAPLIGWLLQCSNEVRTPPARARTISLFLLALAAGSVVVPP